MKNLHTAIRELSLMEKILMVPNDPAVNAESSNNKAIHAALKAAEDADYLFVVNDSRQSEQAAITLPGAQSGKGENIHREGEHLAMDAGRIAIELPAYGVSVYRFPKGAFK